MAWSGCVKNLYALLYRFLLQEEIFDFLPEFKAGCWMAQQMAQFQQYYLRLMFMLTLWVKSPSYFQLCTYVIWVYFLYILPCAEISGWEIVLSASIVG